MYSGPDLPEGCGDERARLGGKGGDPPRINPPCNQRGGEGREREGGGAESESNLGSLDRITVSSFDLGAVNG